MRPRRFLRDESGSGLLFGAFTLFAAVGAAVLVMDAWEGVRLKIQAQGAADAASYSACSLLTNAYGMVAALNDTLVWLYRIALGMIAAVVVSGTLVAMNVLFPGLFLWALPMFEASLQTANAWLPRIRVYAERVAAVEDRIVLNTPRLVQVEAFRIARANGAEGAVLLPPEMHLLRETNFDRFAEKITGGGIPAWTVRWLFPRKALREGAEVRQDVEEYEDTSGQNIEGGIQNRELRKKFHRFVGIIQEFAKNPLPLPYVLTEGVFRSSIQAVAWTPTKGMRRDTAPSQGALSWPSRAPSQIWTAANTRPFHPKLLRREIDTTLENLYVERGWNVLWVPVQFTYRHGERVPLGEIGHALEPFFEH